MKKREIYIWLTALILCTSCVTTPPADTSSSQPEQTSAASPEQLGDDEVYINEEYGFAFTLPGSWQGYSVVTDAWEGRSIHPEHAGEITETGPLLNIRHPLWTAAEPRQDIPIMIFTIGQWDLMSEEDGFHIGAAPINPGELGRNSEYVFATPARYNFAFLPGYEEIEDILDNSALQPIERNSDDPSREVTQVPTAVSLFKRAR